MNGESKLFYCSALHQVVSEHILRILEGDWVIGCSWKLEIQIKMAMEIKGVTQRNAIFKTTHKCQGKVCIVMVDSGSLDNLVSQEMVEKLHLERIPHESPYSISWVNGEHALLVKGQAWVEFHIGAYRDKIFCDVVPMSVCHILFRMPWMYDKLSLYDGRENSYKIKKDGVTFSLIPLIEEYEKQWRTKRIFM